MSSPTGAGRNRIVAEPLPILSTSGFQKRSSSLDFDVGLLILVSSWVSFERDSVLERFRLAKDVVICILRIYLLYVQCM